VSDEQRISGSTTPERVGGPAKGEGRGGPASGYSWPPFQPGHTLSLKHGAYATLHLRPRAGDIAARLRDALGDSFEEKHAPAIEAAAMAGARVERAMAVLLADVESADELTHEEAIARLSQDARGWLRQYVEILDRLGLTPRVGADGASGPTTLVVVSAFPGVLPYVDVVDVEEATELPALEEGDPPPEIWNEGSTSVAPTCTATSTEGATE
jgi:hypothetical protein